MDTTGCLAKGLSAQYGDIADNRIYFNFTALDNGEVQIRTQTDTIIMSAGAFQALQQLVSTATNRTIVTTPDSIYLEWAGSGDDPHYWSLNGKTSFDEEYQKFLTGLHEVVSQYHPFKLK